MLAEKSPHLAKKRPHLAQKRPHLAFLLILSLLWQVLSQEGTGATWLGGVGWGGGLAWFCFFGGGRRSG